MSEKRLSVEERLGLVAFTIDEEPHIKLKEEVCGECEARYCLFVCPANANLCLLSFLINTLLKLVQGYFPQTFLSDVHMLFCLNRW